MSSGLEGVVVAETVLSEVDGEAGELVIRGYRLEEFAGLGFEGAAERLLGAGYDWEHGRREAFRLLSGHFEILRGRTPVEALRLGLSALPSEVGAEVVAGAFPAILGASRHGRQTSAPTPGAGHVLDLLAMFTGRQPEAAEVEGLSRYLVTVSEHGMNASTFTARVIASTEAPLLDAVVGALGALKGPLHGGAPGPVLDLLDQMAASPDVAGDLRAKIARGERLMGFGHRIYRTRDPRADVLKAALAGLSESPRLQLAQEVERLATEALRQAKPNRRLDTNVEFYTAVLLERLGFSRETFTALFATGRVLGWIAHYQEQRALGRLIRPNSTYVGPRPEALA
jgi:citrate synthase